MVDTGAANTHLDRARTSELGLKWQRLAVDPLRAVPGAAYEFCFVSSVELGSIRTGELRVGNNDLTDFNSLTRVYGEPQFDGLLGGDVLRRFAAVIKYKTKDLFLRRPGSEKADTARQQGRGLMSRSFLPPDERDNAELRSAVQQPVSEQGLDRLQKSLPDVHINYPAWSRDEGVPLVVEMWGGSPRTFLRHAGFVSSPLLSELGLQGPRESQHSAMLSGQRCWNCAAPG
jgi:hypothetical protein